MATDIKSFYNKKCVFLTGATGFMGTVLTEKLLRSCKDIQKIYLLMRPKGANAYQNRLDELLSSKAFDGLRESKMDYLHKLVPVYGDLSDSNLNIKDAELLEKIQSEVSVVFHMAASVKFNEVLKKAVESNVLGTINVLEFCRKLKKLEVVVHVSTAYTNCDKDDVEEKIYKMPINVRQFIKDLPEDGDYLKLTKSFTKLPNSYNLSKALAEHLMDEEFQDLPLVIVRPSIVIGACNEPKPGWLTANLGSPSGLIAGAAKGLIHSLRADAEKITDYIPVDYVVNVCIASSWYYSTHRPGKIVVYHAGSSHLNPLTWGDFTKYLDEELNRSPTKDLAWYPSCVLRNSDFMHKLDSYLYHQLPARFIDVFLALTGKKPFMVRLYHKIEQLEQVLTYYAQNQNIFYSDNAVKLFEALDPLDQKDFDFDVRKLNWPQYLTTYYHGIRTHLLKDDPATIPAGRIVMKRMRRIQLLTRFVIFCGLSLLLFLLFRIFG